MRGQEVQVATKALQTSDEPELRTAILAAARELLLQRGLGSFSLRQVARSVGRSATSIYLHFQSKSELVHALIEEGFELLHEELELAAAGESPLKAIGQAYLDFGQKRPGYYELMFLTNVEVVGRHPAHGYRRARRSLELLSRALLPELGDSTHDLDLRTLSLWSALHGIVSVELGGRLDSRVDVTRFRDRALAQALAGAVSAEPAS
jgi:AcrR family transcriptional regulator